MAKDTWDDAKEVESGGIFTWKDKPVGTKLVGVYTKGERIKTSQSDNALLCTLETADGEVGFFAGTILEQKFEKVPEGALVKVEYTGDKKTNSGRSMKEFSVKVKENPSEALLEAEGISVMKEVEDDEAI